LFRTSTRRERFERKVNLSTPWFARLRPDGWIGTNAQQVRGLVIQPHRLERGDKAARRPAGDCAGFLANRARQGAGQRMRQQLPDSDDVPGN
jgi:hypothetical protein